MIYLAWIMAVTATLFVVLGAVAIGYFMLKLAQEIFSDRNKLMSCKWTKDEDSMYSTECRNSFYNSDDTGEHVTEWAKYCPYCGRKIL